MPASAAVAGHPPARRPRAAAAAAVAVLAALAATGCASFDKAFGQQEAVVQFKPQTPNSVRLKVRAACSHLPNAVPEPLPTDHLASDLLNDVRYQVNNASDGDLAKLQDCLQKFPSVAGIEFSSPGGG
ncbi:MAG TPA: hypothetical protein VG123_26735 [Streptosporangiaceae bacterium]|nr:hypothetical protein [Streptosporangiaceae bacterium]